MKRTQINGTAGLPERQECTPSQQHCLRSKNQSSESDNNVEGLILCNALSVDDSPSAVKWIVDSGATCHICNNEKLFHKFNRLSTAQEVPLGDGRALLAVGYRDVLLKTKLPNGKVKNADYEMC